MLDAGGPPLVPPELTRHASDARDSVNEALLLGETEDLFSWLDPTAFALSSSSPAAGAQRSSTEPHVVGLLPPSATDAAPVVRRPGRRAWKINATRNPSRERLQIELATLRQRASELEMELTTARAHREELRRHKALLIPTWERIAKRQHRARNASEDENFRLKRLVAGQRVFVTQLQHTWLRWQRMTSLDPYSQLSHVTVRFDANDPALFDMLIAELDLQYMRLDQVFRDAGLQDRSQNVPSATVNKIRALTNGQVVPFLEVSVVEDEPHDYNLLAEVTWQCMQDPSSQPNQIVYSDIPFPERTGAMKLRATTVHGGAEVAVELLLVNRRYVERDRTTYVWKSLLRADDGGREFSDTFTEESGWITMQSLEPQLYGGRGANSSRGTLTLTCVHIEPKRQHTLLQTRGGIVQDPLMRLVEEQFRGSFERMNELVEDRILGAVLG